LKNFKPSNRTLHSAVRIYYMVRNHLYLSKKYKKHFSEDIKRSRKDILVRIKNNFLYAQEKPKLIKYLFSAYADAKRNKNG